MSSLLEWPTIFGSVYFLPGVIVVVLLLLLLLLMSSRRRARAERARLSPEPAPAVEGPAVGGGTYQAPALPQTYSGYPAGMVAQPVAMPMQPTGVVTQPVGVVTQPTMMTPQPAMASAVTMVSPPVTTFTPAMTAMPTAGAMTAPVGTASVATAAALDVLPEEEPIFDLGPASRRSRSKTKTTRSTARLSVVSTASAPAGTDPLNATIQEILDGWGELTPEDMKRLELFRADRLSEALTAVQLSKSKSNDAKVRLSQMRQYAAGLERRAQDIQMAQAATAAAALAAATAAAPQAGGAPDAGPSPATVVQPPFEQRSPIFAGYATPVVPAVAAGLSAPVMPAAPPAPSTAVPEATPASRSFYDAEPPKPAEIDPPAAVADPASSWAEPRPVWEPDPEPELEEMPAPVFDEIEMEPAEVQLDTSGLGAALNEPMGMPMRETFPAEEESEDTFFAAAPPRIELPSYSGAPFDDDLFWDDEPAAVAPLSAKVETAEQLLALPPNERVDMAALLPPTELAAAFRATHDPELKKAVIDTLEHIGTPSSLNALGCCFEDADSDIQVYALAAADRLLGMV